MAAKPAARAPGLDAKKMTGELFTLTYGALVAQLLADCEDDDAVNAQLDKIGYNMGTRMIDDFLAKNANVGKCADLRTVADVLAKKGLKTYLGVVATVSNWSSAGDEFSLVFETNPLIEFVELPAEQAHAGRLQYSQCICGAIRGAMQAVHIEVAAWFVQDQLAGAATNEIRVRFVRRVEETVPVGDD